MLTGREMRSRIDEDGTLTVSLERVPVPDPGAGEIVVRIEAAPINPSDLGLLLGPANVSSAQAAGNRDRPVLTMAVSQGALAGVHGRLGQSLAIGNEGAGTVVSAGPGAEDLIGRRVGMMGGAMFADYRLIRAQDVIPLPDGVTAAQGAAMFVNPLTALGFVESARQGGHKAIIHTAAASNLGQMLVKVCLADDIPLINIVRSAEQVEILRAIGARHVLDSTTEGFADRLADLSEQTGATIAFDAVGGGDVVDTIMQAMERAAQRRSTEYSRYGSDTFKQIYIYGALDFAPTVLRRLSYGFAWSVSGWLLFPFLRKAGIDAFIRLKQRVVDELTTTFASNYSRVIGLGEALDPDTVRAYQRKATGEKFLIDPTRG